MAASRSALNHVGPYASCRHGQRCAACRAKHAQQEAARRRLGIPERATPQHGYLTMARHHRCPCEACAAFRRLAAPDRVRIAGQQVAVSLPEPESAGNDVAARAARIAN